MEEHGRWLGRRNVRNVPLASLLTGIRQQHDRLATRINNILDLAPADRRANSCLYTCPVHIVVFVVMGPSTCKWRLGRRWNPATCCGSWCAVLWRAKRAGGRVCFCFPCDACYSVCIFCLLGRGELCWLSNPVGGDVWRRWTDASRSGPGSVRGTLNGSGWCCSHLWKRSRCVWLGTGQVLIQ